MVAFIPPKQAGKYKAVASGAITNGKPVAIDTDGTVGSVGLTFGSATQFEAGRHKKRIKKI